jgi:hypothetical protein
MKRKKKMQENLESGGRGKGNENKYNHATNRFSLGTEKQVLAAQL